MNVYSELLCYIWYYFHSPYIPMTPFYTFKWSFPSINADERGDLHVPVLISILFCSGLHFSLLSWNEHNFWYFNFVIFISLFRSSLDLVFALPNSFNFNIFHKMMSDLRLLHQSTHFSFGEKTLILKHIELKLIISCSLKKWSKEWKGQVELVFLQTDEVFSLIGSLVYTLYLYVSHISSIFNFDSFLNSSTIKYIAVM